MPEKNKIGHRQRLRDQFISGDKNSQPEEFLMELLLTYGIPLKDVRPLAKKLIERFGGLSGVLDADYEGLCKINGVKSNTAVLLKLVDWIRSHYPIKNKSETKSSPKQRTQLELFDISDEDREQIDDKKRHEERQRQIPLPIRKAVLFSQAVLKEAIAILPNLPDTDSLGEIRQFLLNNLHYSSEQTRDRYASYIIQRVFPNGRADRSIRRFAKNFHKSIDLREVCFYRFMKYEPLMEQVIEDLFLPSVGRGEVTRQKIRDYLRDRFPTSGNINKCTKAIVDALDAGGIAKVDRVKVQFGYRNILIPAFSFVLHSEFPEPGIYDISKLEMNKTIQAMLWNPDRILPSLYEIRNLGIISKVSEIDNVRQFTTKWTLEEVVEKLTVKERNA